MPDFSHESDHGGRVAGVDEVGRGPLAGPVVAAAVVFPAGLTPALAELLDDSKKLTAEQRNAAYAALFASGLAEIAVGAASVAEISRINILRASLLAMRRAVARLPTLPDLALIDGNMKAGMPCPERCIIGGDALCISIAAASIVAKVVRDRLMTRLSVRYAEYGWHSNAGYSTPPHRAAISLHGPCRHHRPTFGAVRMHIAGIAAELALGVGAELPLGDAAD